MSVSGDVVRYGDQVVLESCECEEALFLGILRRKFGRRNALQLSTEVAEAEKHPPSDYQWRLLPVPGSKRKLGEAVAYADAIRLHMIDDKGQSRMLAVSHLDDRSIMAERRPASESCIWRLSYCTELSIGRDGRVTPAGDFAAFLQYGDVNYLTLVNRAGYLGAADDQYRILRKRTMLFDELPERGMSAWWRMRRSVTDVVPIVPHELRTASPQANAMPSLSAL